MEPGDGRAVIATEGLMGSNRKASMSTPDDPQLPTEAPMEQFLNSEELADAIEHEDFPRLLDHLPIGIAIFRQRNGRARICYANATLEQVIGRSPIELKGADWSVFDDFRHEDVETLTLSRAAQENEDFLGTFLLEAPDAGSILVQAWAGQGEGHDGVEAYRILALIDVTDRERSQRDEVERRVRDKDLLLKELQHRVKNNLQLITALIRLEARTVRPNESGVLARLAGRIESLALLYQTLASENAGGEVDLGSYLSQIASAVVRTHTLPGIELEMKVIYAPASINVAMPVGLLVNEIMTNAFKYAFAGREGGTVTLECRYEEGRFELVVADDGNGMPEGAEWPQRGKLASLIMQTLRENTRDMRFAVETAPGKGTRVVLVFVHQAGLKVH